MTQNAQQLSYESDSESEYKFNHILASFAPLLAQAFEIPKSDLPDQEELMEITEISYTVGTIKKIKKPHKKVHYLLPKHTTPSTALALFCYIVLVKKFPDMILQEKKFHAMKFLFRSHLTEELYRLAKIQTKLFNDISFRGETRQVNFAIGVASYLYFEKFFTDEGRQNLLKKEYPIYSFFNNALEKSKPKPKIGFGIPETLEYINIEDAQPVKLNLLELPARSFQSDSNINSYFDFSTSIRNKDGEEEFPPTYVVKAANEEMIRVLNQGRGIDFDLKNDFNIITIREKIEDADLKNILMGTAIYERGKVESNSTLDTEDRNIVLTPGPIKKSPRTIEKYEKDYNKDASFLTDIVRCTFVCKNAEQLTKFNSKFFQKMLDAGCHLASRPKDKFTNPTPVGYGDINCIFILPQGFAIEVQISLIEMILAKSESHSHYAIQRKFEGIPEDQLTPQEKEMIAKADAAQKTLYRDARIKSGLSVEVINKQASYGREVKFYDYNGMPAFMRDGNFYCIDYSNTFKKVTDPSYKHDAMLLTREQFDTLVVEFKKLLILKK